MRTALDEAGQHAGQAQVGAEVGAAQHLVGAIGADGPRADDLERHGFEIGAVVHRAPGLWVRVQDHRHRRAGAGAGLETALKAAVGAGEDDCGHGLVPEFGAARGECAREVGCYIETACQKARFPQHGVL